MVKLHMAWVNIDNGLFIILFCKAGMYVCICIELYPIHSVHVQSYDCLAFIIRTRTHKRTVWYEKLNLSS